MLGIIYFFGLLVFGLSYFVRRVAQSFGSGFGVT